MSPPSSSPNAWSRSRRPASRACSTQTADRRRSRSRSRWRSSSAPSATGFGRTGRMFACEYEDVAPDLMCVGKGITGGYLPLAATLASEKVYEGFLGAADQQRTFFHGHTYTGNPLACAAAIATLELFRSERTLEALQPKIELMTRLLAQRVAILPGVAEVRQRGFMVGIELIEQPPADRLGHRVAVAARRRGAVIRPLGDVVVLMPPLAISEADLRRLVAITATSIAEATSGRFHGALGACAAA